MDGHFLIGHFKPESEGARGGLGNGVMVQFMPFLVRNLPDNGAALTMKVVILAGGYGTRLLEETVVKPKPMVEIGG